MGRKLWCATIFCLLTLMWQGTGFSACQTSLSNVDPSINVGGIALVSSGASGGLSYDACQIATGGHAFRPSPCQSAGNVQDYVYCRFIGSTPLHYSKNLASTSYCGYQIQCASDSNFTSPGTHIYILASDTEKNVGSSITYGSETGQFTCTYIYDSKTTNSVTRILISCEGGTGVFSHVTSVNMNDFVESTQWCKNHGGGQGCS